MYDCPSASALEPYLRSAEQLGLCGCISVPQAAWQVCVLSHPFSPASLVAHIKDGEAESLQSSGAGLAVSNAECGIHLKGDNVRHLIGRVSRGERNKRNPQKQQEPQEEQCTLR